MSDIMSDEFMFNLHHCKLIRNEWLGWDLPTVRITAHDGFYAWSTIDRGDTREVLIPKLIAGINRNRENFMREYGVEGHMWGPDWTYDRRVKTAVLTPEVVENAIDKITEGVRMERIDFIKPSSEASYKGDIQQGEQPE